MLINFERVQNLNFTTNTDFLINLAGILDIG